MIITDRERYNKDMKSDEKEKREKVQIKKETLLL